jgi:hypothetical protein
MAPTPKHREDFLRQLLGIGSRQSQSPEGSVHAIVLILENANIALPFRVCGQRFLAGHRFSERQRLSFLLPFGGFLVEDISARGQFCRLTVVCHRT